MRRRRRWYQDKFSWQAKFFQFGKFFLEQDQQIPRILEQDQQIPRIHPDAIEAVANLWQTP
jgi:hypothetical protein